ncbi:ANTAR domain-containing protein [Streptomyces nodosus]|uniref:ANTAR domain-containing protein n=1 Tax=Streptomyces nodosus TaxID=40318 RepID=A0A5P2VX46_9ACTN|nr:ANTAR domain-containing protein [Streptomyces nodosus]MBB4790026.1 anti-anti-sigma factor [Streptomyces nodosus]QEV37745.1 ANTAR domain-containing protein [Streptomyces nodosus]
MPEPAHDVHSTTRGLVVDARPEGDRVAVTVTGTVGLDEDQTLERALRHAVSDSVAGIDLDLSGVTHCDGSALSVLLSTRRRALAQRKTITLVATSPMAQQLLNATGTRGLFPGRSGRSGASRPPTGTRVPGEDTDTELSTEVVQLRRAMQTRPDIDMARGVLMASFGLSRDQAWTVLVTTSQNSNTKLHRVARDVVTAVTGEPLSGPLRRHLTAAVARVGAPEPADGRRGSSATAAAAAERSA